MNKFIWTCWFQGRDRAPTLVEQCISSWERQNPGWAVRCLDGESARRLTDLDQVIDADGGVVTAASASDILRIMLLHEFGGVWVDATVLCNRPLDEWLQEALEPQGFFGFDRPARTRPIASWFLAAEPQAPIVEGWFAETLDYWQDRNSSDDYFWFHHLFRELLAKDPNFAAAWEKVPKISADGPHSLQREDRMYRPIPEVSDEIDFSAPVFKLTHRLKAERAPGSFVEQLTSAPRRSSDSTAHEVRDDAGPALDQFASLSVTTDNVGDHIQIIAADRLLARLGEEPAFRVDRDEGLALPPTEDGSSVGLILNGWFKRGSGGWPPHPNFVPIPIGLHLRPNKSSSLLSDQSLAFLGRNAPIGSRDNFTAGLLQVRGIDAWKSNCLSTLFTRRPSRPHLQTEIFVVSRDKRLLQVLPFELKGATYINHYTEEGDFAFNMSVADDLLRHYSDRAALIVTTLLHCALPAIAMGIPVVVFYPHNTPAGHASDVERFSSLAELVPIHSLDSPSDVDWHPAPVDLSEQKLKVLERFFALVERWKLPERPPITFAPPARTS